MDYLLSRENRCQQIKKLFAELGRSFSKARTYLLITLRGKTKFTFLRKNGDRLLHNLVVTENAPSLGAFLIFQAVKCCGKRQSGLQYSRVSY